MDHEQAGKRLPGLADGVCVILLIIASALAIGFFLPLALTALTNAAVTMLLFFIVPFSYVWLRDYSITDTFRLNRPRWKSVVVAILLTVAVWFVLGFLEPLQRDVFKSLDVAYESKMERVEQFLGQAMSMNLAYAILFLALVPAIVEEFFFRGFLLNVCSRRLGRGGALILTSLLFSLSHVDLPRLFPTFLLGLYFGSCVLVTRSVWPSIAAHFFNNAMAVVIAGMVRQQI